MKEKVSRSSTEAEYRAMASTSAEKTCFSTTLSLELGFHHAILRCDNQSAITLKRASSTKQGNAHFGFPADSSSLKHSERIKIGLVGSCRLFPQEIALLRGLRAYSLLVHLSFSLLIFFIE